MVGGASQEAWLKAVKRRLESVDQSWFSLNGIGDTANHGGSENLETFEVQGVADEPIVLPISTGPATGHRWHLDLPTSVVRIEDESGGALEHSVRFGGSEGGHIRVKASTGDHIIVARLARPWDSDHPVRQVRIHLHVVSEP